MKWFTLLIKVNNIIPKRNSLVPFPFEKSSLVPWNLTQTFSMVLTNVQFYPYSKISFIYLNYYIPN